MSDSLHGAVNSAAVASNAAAITPADGADLPNAALKGIWVGGAGNVRVDMVGSGTSIIFNGVPAGTLLRIRAKRVYATNTTATNMIALY